MWRSDASTTGVSANRLPILSAARSRAVRTLRSGSAIRPGPAWRCARLCKQVVSEELVDRPGIGGFGFGLVSLALSRYFSPEGPNVEHRYDGGAEDHTQEACGTKRSEQRITPAPAGQSAGWPDRSGHDRSILQKAPQVIGERKGGGVSPVGLFFQAFSTNGLEGARDVRGGAGEGEQLLWILPA